MLVLGLKKMNQLFILTKGLKIYFIEDRSTLYKLMQFKIFSDFPWKKSSLKYKCKTPRKIYMCKPGSDLALFCKIYTLTNIRLFW